MTFETKEAFTLLELIIVILVIAILVTLALPGYQKFREKAIATEAINALSKIIREYRMTQDSSAISDANPQMKYWDYYGIAMGSSDIVTLKAGRNSGPYEESTIVIEYHKTDGTISWWGSHPGVPKE